MAAITFTDAIGAATLRNSAPAPGDRFANWAPLSKPVGSSVQRDSDGLTFMFRRRDDFAASFELPGISAKTVGGVAPVDIADRLIYWLENGGTCTVETEDSNNNSYATCALKAGTQATLLLTDKQNLEYTLSLTLVNVAANPVRMVCHYDGGT